MDNKAFAISSQNIDGAQEGRQRALKAMQRRPWFGRRTAMTTPGNLRVRDIDVLSRDMRSVKAYLGGRGDFRAAWWNFYQACYKFFKPTSTLEQAMYSFHSMHHKITLARLQFFAEVDQRAREVDSMGLAGLLGTRAK